ncbi:MAG TPA: sulfatase-like hydrolase/transferase [Bacillaceae bacterium]|nr:alkaline phosphatase family protein [Paenibacillus bovis]HLU22981.1 sulfatase-like hydrolase/transferase [Bacillaceae bacterium]
MGKVIKVNSLFIYFIISVFFMEIIFRIHTIEDFELIDLIRSGMFLIVFAIIFYLISTLFKGMSKFLLSVLFLTLVAFIYSSQLIYFKFFRTYYSAYSVGNGAQVLEFWKDIATLLKENIVWILLLFLPVLVIIVFGRKLASFEKIGWGKRLVLICCIVLVQLIGIGAVNVSGKEQNSAYDLYYNSSLPLLSVERLGLLTTMRLDLQRLLTHWSPKLEPPQPLPNNSSQVSGGKKNQEKQVEEDVVEIIEYNVMDIDFSKLIGNEKNEEVKAMHKFFQSMEPTAKNDMTGKYKGYNLILLTAEGFSPYAVHKEVTPTLYKLVHEGYNFSNFYTPIWGVSTSDGEYVALQSLIPKSGVWSFQRSGSNHLPFVLGNQLKKLNYKTNAYHNHTYTYYGRNISHPNMGYDYKGLGNGLDVKETWPESDLEMLEKTVDDYINNEPFHAYYMTVSGHMQYSFTGNYIAWKNKKHVEHLPYSEQAKAYLATQIELDRALEHLLNKLEEAGVADRTLIALSADHYPYGLDDETIDELAGHNVEKNFELYKSTFILYNKGMEPTTITKPASSLDILPTLSNLMGIEYDSRLLMGRDIFSDSMPLVTFLNKSFITDKGKYNAVTGKFIANDGVEVDAEYVEYVKSLVQAKFYYSTKILDHNYYKKILPN